MQHLNFTHPTQPSFPIHPLQPITLHKIKWLTGQEGSIRSPRLKWQQWPTEQSGREDKYRKDYKTVLRLWPQSSGQYWAVYLSTMIQADPKHTNVQSGLWAGGDQFIITNVVLVRVFERASNSMSIGHSSTSVDSGSDGTWFCLCYQSGNSSDVWKQ